MNLKLYTDAVLARDVPEHNLRRGDIVKLVHHHAAAGGKEGYSVEVLNALGDTLDVVAIDAADLEPLREDEIPCVRRLAS